MDKPNSRTHDAPQASRRMRCIASLILAPAMSLLVASCDDAGGRDDDADVDRSSRQAFNRFDQDFDPGAYYATIDAPPSEAAFRRKYFDGSSTYRAVYRNDLDLGFKRDTTCTEEACIIKNNDGAAYVGMFRDGEGDVQFVGYVPCDNSEPGCNDATKLANTLDLDGTGEKSLPSLCYHCHAGEPEYLGNGGVKLKNVQFIALNRATLQAPYSSECSDPNAGCTNDNIYEKMNALLGVGIPTYSEWSRGVAWPPGSNPAQAYADYDRYCLGCHDPLAKGGRIDLSTYRNLIAFKDVVISDLCNDVMPLANQTHSAFWTSTGASEFARALYGKGVDCHNERGYDFAYEITGGTAGQDQDGKYHGIFETFGSAYKALLYIRNPCASVVVSDVQGTTGLDVEHYAVQFAKVSSSNGNATTYTQTDSRDSVVFLTSDAPFSFRAECIQ